MYKGFCNIILVLAAAGCSTTRAEKSAVVGTQKALFSRYSAPLVMQGRWPVVQIFLNDNPRPFAFIVDTAAGSSVLDGQLAAQLMLNPTENRKTVQGASGAGTETSQVELATLTLAGARITKTKMLVTDMGAFDPQTRQYQGILGNDILGRYSYSFDVAAGHLTFSNQENLDPEIWTRCVANAFGPDRAPELTNFTAVSFQAGGVVAVGVLDTGAAGTVLNPLIGDHVRGVVSNVQPSNVAGFDPNAKTAAYRMNIQQLSLGGVELTDTSVRVSDLPVFASIGLAQKSAAIVGIDILRRVPFSVTRGSSKICFRQ
jgi:predicted aspartyl protease